MGWMEKLSVIGAEVLLWGRGCCEVRKNLGAIGDSRGNERDDREI